jgi:predicted permease
VRILPVRLPAFSFVRIDPSVFALTGCLSIITGILLGVAAARRASQRDFLESIKASRGSALLTTAQLAVAVVVTIGAGLLLRSLQQLQRTDPGFEADNLVMARFEVPSRYAGDARFRVAPQIADRLRALPEVQTAALTILDPFVYGGISRGITLEGHTPLSAAEQDEIYVQEISPDYFSTMKIPLRSGRDFTSQDNNSALRVVIVSHAMAERYWPGQNVVGKKIRFGAVNSNYEWMQVVGEAADVRVASLRADPNSNMVLYAPLAQSEVITNMSAVVRTKTEPAAFAGTLRAEIQRFDPEMPVYSVATMDERIEGETEATRSFALLLVMCALLGGGLAAVGAYAAMAARVSSRVREIGIRMAVGADPVSVLGMVMGQGVRLATAGIVVGLAAGLGAGHLLTSELYGVAANDVSTFVLTAGLVFSVAMVACWIPARRAMRVDPVAVLRNK